MSRLTLLLASLLAGAQMLAATTAFVDMVPTKTAALIAALVGSAQLALATYVHGLQTPTPPARSVTAAPPPVVDINTRQG